MHYVVTINNSGDFFIITGRVPRRSSEVVVMTAQITSECEVVSSILDKISSFILATVGESVRTRVGTIIQPLFCWLTRSTVRRHCCLF